MDNRTKSEVIDIVKCVEKLYNNNGIKKKKVKPNYIDINIIDLVLLSMSIDELPKRKV